MKVALGRALIHGPAHLVLDEPTSGLDVPTADVTAAAHGPARFRRLHRLSSHVLGDVEGLCDRSW